MQFHLTCGGTENKVSLTKGILAVIVFLDFQVQPILLWHFRKASVKNAYYNTALYCNHCNKQAAYFYAYCP